MNVKSYQGLRECLRFSMQGGKVSSLSRYAIQSPMSSSSSSSSAAAMTKGDNRIRYVRRGFQSEIANSSLLHELLSKEATGVSLRYA